MKTIVQFSEFAIGRIVGAGAIIWLTVVATVNAQAQYTYTTISVPGAVDTYANGIDGTNIVGTYTTVTDTNEGFIYNGSTYTTLSVPGAEQTEVNGISGTNIVGAYLNSYGYWEGFRYNGSTYNNFNVENAIDTWPMGISGNNIVGYYEGYVGTLEELTNFFYNGSVIVGLSVPGATFDTACYGVSGTNIVGSYWSGAYEYGFWYNGKSFVTLNVPGAMDTAAYGISGSNLVGQCSAGGFLYNTNTKTYTTFSMPNASATLPTAISGKFIVGTYENHSGVYYGFLATPAPASLTATNVAGKFKLTVSGPSDSTIVQVSTNILSWVNVYTNTPPFTFTDSAFASFPSRYYRAMVRQ